VDDPTTVCAATTCAEDEKVRANTCIPCADGFENEAGDDASGADTACSLIPTTGMCTGNTDTAADVTCAEGLLLKPNPRTVEGNTTDQCCDEIPDDAPKVEHRWRASSWSPAVCPALQCASSSLARTVACFEITIYSNDLVSRAEVDSGNCTDSAPADTQDCPALDAGDACDDGNAETTGDVCSDGEVCQGQKVLKSSLTFPVDAASVALPAAGEDVDSSAAATAVKGAIRPSLETAFGVTGSDLVLTIVSIHAGSLLVDFNVAVPATTTTDSSAKSAATAAIAAATPPALPAADSSGGTVDAGTPLVAPFRSYAYSRIAGCSAGTDCSTACGYEGETADDVYRCLEDGSAVSTAACEAAGIGPVPDSESTCCPPADEDTCDPSDTDLTEKCPEGWATDDSLSAAEKAECLKEDPESLLIVVIVIVAALLVAAFVVKKMCCGEDDAKDTASTNDVQEDAPASDRRADLEKQLAQVREQQALTAP
jgi:hypothetical protein